MLGSTDSTGGMDRPLSEEAEEAFCEVVLDTVEPAEEAFEELVVSAPSEQPVKTAAVIAARTAKRTMPLVGFFMKFHSLLHFRENREFTVTKHRFSSQAVLAGISVCRNRVFITRFYKASTPPSDLSKMRIRSSAPVLLLT